MVKVGPAFTTLFPTERTSLGTPTVVRFVGPAKRTLLLPERQREPAEDGPPDELKAPDGPAGVLVQHGRDHERPVEQRLQRGPPGVSL